MKRLAVKLVLFCALAGLCNVVNAQSLAQAKELYTQGKYAEAKPAFERLVKQAPSNASYNQWYGVCCYETGEIEKAEKYLSFAVKRKVIEGFRYLGEVYYHTFRFEQATEMYEEYISWLEKKKRNTEEAELRLETMENAARMLSKVEAVEVIDSIIVDKKSFLEAYTLSEESGSLIYAQDFFDSVVDSSAVYMNQKKDKIYYAKPTDDKHYCLFTQSWLMDHWGDEKQLPMNINSNEDDNYPFVLSDGVTMYYASKGNGSLGGYDLFVTRYNTNTDSYLSPEQLGMPFNSPYNDYMMVIDEVKNLGWFVSDRFQPEGSVCVYLFIPNKEHKRIESEDLELKRAQASLRSIQKTWKADTDYSELIELAQQEIPFGRPQQQVDFTFPVTTDKVYYTWDEFRSAEAKNLYRQAYTTQKQLSQLKKTMEAKRKTYSASKNPTEKEQLKTELLQAEEKQLVLQNQIDELTKQARNTEVIQLKKK